VAFARSNREEVIVEIEDFVKSLTPECVDVRAKVYGRHTLGIFVILKRGEIPFRVVFGKISFEDWLFARRHAEQLLVEWLEENHLITLKDERYDPEGLPLPSGML